MCNLYSLTTNQDAIRQMFAVEIDNTGNLPSLPGIYPNYAAPIVRNTPAGRELAMARWGMPTQPKFLEGRKYDGGETNIRNLKSPHWRRWLGIGHRCLVPFTSFAEPEKLPTGRSQQAWFAADDSRPLLCFPGIYVNGWTSVRKVKDGPTTDDLFAFLTTEPNAEVRPYHPRAMPVIFRTQEQCETWLSAPLEGARQLQQPLPDGILRIVARGTPTDGPAGQPQPPQQPGSLPLFSGSP
jgi:putative SOS response-associated peptidase YedK